ncbi:hypothetical protein [Kitasatospora sp. NPDC098663]|uniref:hypothetical protein n=1 Tax=Kitasatospora sp. NPDC098663 TaxID=3364096 RepID=UPI00381F464E
MKVYRITVSAYNSRRDFPSAWFTYDVRAIDRDHAVRALPRTHRGPANVQYRDDLAMARVAMPHFGPLTTAAYYPEWSVTEFKLRVGPRGVSQARWPKVWLGKTTSVLLIEQGLCAVLEPPQPEVDEPSDGDRAACLWCGQEVTYVDSMGSLMWLINDNPSCGLSPYGDHEGEANG